MNCRTVIRVAPLALLLLATPVAADDDSWVDRITFKGDFRLRYEMIDKEGAANRNRARFRARFGLSARVADDVNFVLRLASGGGNPVSTNQTFGNGFSTKDIGIDLAYIDWKMTDKLTFLAGKMKNPLYRAGSVPLVWDSDWNPEGLALMVKSGAMFASAGAFFVEERSDSDDSILLAVQGGMILPLGNSNSITVGAGFFAYTNTIGNEPFYNGRSKGNTVEQVGLDPPVDSYLFEYKNTELFAQFDTLLGDWPVKIYAHATHNSEVSRQDTAWAIGAKMGAAKKHGEMEFSWTYQDIDADAVIATFNDSDFGGGGTDADGHLLKVKYAISPKIILGGTLFVNHVERFQGVERDYSRLQLDVEFKFN